MSSAVTSCFVSRRPSSLLAWLVLAASLLVVHPLWAQPQVSASIYPAKITPGGSATFTIIVAGGRPSTLDTPPELPEGMELMNPTAEYSETLVTIGGMQQMALTMNWRVTCQEAGIYIIPSQKVQIRGDIYQTRTTKLEVKDDPNATSENDPILSLKAEKQEMYEGEVVPLTVTLYIHGRTLLRRPGLIELPKDNFAVQRFPLQPDEENVVRFGGVPYRANIFHSTVSGMKPGKFTLGPASTEVHVEVPVAGEGMPRSYYADSEVRKFKATSSDLEIHVLPLPKEGRPGTFSGAVGDFAIGMVAEPLEVNVGDPISVEITISGTGNFDAVSMPTLTDPKAWKLYPARKFQSSGSGIPLRQREQRLTFTQIILPNREVKEIPPFEFSFFSPTKKQYEIRRTQAMPIKVTSVGPKTPEAPAPGPASAAGSTGPASSERVPMVKPAITDILTNTPPHAAWIGSSIPLFSDQRFRTANYIAGGVLLFIILGKVGLFALRARSQSPDAPARRLWNTLHRRHSRADFYTLAVQYAYLKGTAGDSLAELERRQEELNYARNSDNATAEVPGEERNRVLRALRGAALPQETPPTPSPAPVTLSTEVLPSPPPVEKEEKP